jgi:hypothetical protein
VKLLPFIICLLLSVSSKCQHPFNYGKTKNIYFFSKADIKRLGIKNIYTRIFRTEPGGMHEMVDLLDDDFSGENSVRGGWFIYDGQKKKPSLQFLIDSSDFVNGTFYEFDESGKISTAGMEGYGSLCATEYQHEKKYTLADQYCKQNAITTGSKIFYWPNGLVKYSVCCKNDTLDHDRFAGDSIVTELKSLPDYSDTTRYVYNSKWQITGTVSKHKPSTSIFQLVSGYASGEYQSFINKTAFESFVDKKIGYRPRLVLFEIYRHAVFTFQYDEKTKKYVRYEEISLE